MDVVLSTLHVVGAVFVVGPMAILPMTALRALRAGNTAQVSTLAKSTAVFSYLSLVVFVLGFALVGMADPKYHLSVTTPWVLWSIVAYVVAVILSLVIVVPTLRRAGARAAGENSADAVAVPMTGYGMIGAGSGAVSLLLVLVVVLMVWKP
ncbi:MAG: DUF2269 family protein [Microbacterium sp.]|uniref:DUF2269 family protein n=1 Tax=Microbacterium sp. TaxID=51671 RepID=UPI001AD4697F|nr:DUF2269 family protein [Microbacterium sp.]MBN9178759.1 DUF2269 family protein [Microbacterium sp.]